MKLSRTQQKVLSVTELDSRLSVNKIARLAKVKSPTATYTISSLLDSGVIRPVVMFNVHALGLTDYCVFFNYQGEESSARKKILDFAIKSPKTAYVAELGGNFSYSVSLFAATIFEIEEFFSSLSTLLPKASFSIQFAIRCIWSMLPHKFLDPSSPALPALIRTKCTLYRDLDLIDIGIIKHLNIKPAASNVALASALSISEGTIRNRRAKLETNGVILGYPYIVNSEVIELFTFRVIIVAKAPSEELNSKLFEFAYAHPRSSAFVRCLGAWNFEISFDVTNPSHSSQILDEIYEKFGKDIRDAYTLTETFVHKAHHFPPSSLSNLSH